MESVFEFTPLVACKLIVYTFGSLIYLFLMVLILGQRRMRRFEWLLFWLMAGLFMWNSGNLLSLNLGLHYGVAANPMTALSRAIPFAGLVMSLSLLVHVHVEYTAKFANPSAAARWLSYAFYLPLIAAPFAFARLIGHPELDALLATRSYVRPIVIWAASALACSAFLNVRATRNALVASPKSLHVGFAGIEAFLAAGLLGTYLLGSPPLMNLGGYFATLLMFGAVVPGGWVGYSIIRNKFPELRLQRNLVYTVLAVFALLIYLDVIRRLSSYLEWKGIVPAVVTETLMIFVLVVLFEPAKKLIDRGLRSAFASEFERVQKLSAEIHECAQQTGDLEMVRQLVAERVPGELRLRAARLELGRSGGVTHQVGEQRKLFQFDVHRGEEILGVLWIEPITSDLSGDQIAALQLLADQLSSALELCRLIGDKVKLERQLAEKAKMAFLGEMAARIAHNVKNPLSSMKTVIQLLEEDSSLPDRVRKDCRLVAGEIDRLNLNISQVLRYAKPPRDVDRPADLFAVAGRIMNFMRPEAERRGVHMEFASDGTSLWVEGGDEAAGDIISNLVVNALEASPPGGNVRIHLRKLSTAEDEVELSIEDDGPGVPAADRSKIFQPFFTTRAGGTGLGLAIVTRRAEEIGGAIECVSPLTGRGGSRFIAKFRSAKVAAVSPPAA